jgi:fructose-specific PTS system IIC-like component
MIGGLVVYYLKKIPVHKVLRSVMPILLSPLSAPLLPPGS